MCQLKVITLLAPTTEQFHFICLGVVNSPNEYKYSDFIKDLGINIPKMKAQSNLYVMDYTIFNMTNFQC